MAPAHVLVREHPGEGAGLLDLLEGADQALLVDAWKSGPEPGVIRRIDLLAEPLPTGLAGTSTHGFGLAEALELGQALGSLPARCIVYAIAGDRFDIGAAPSPQVADAVTATARRILDELVSG
jgi:hydrogenase maturation protease